MKVSPLLLATGALLCGCAPSGVRLGPPPTTPVAKTKDAEAPTFDLTLDNPGPLRLERLGRKLSLGADEAALREVFPKPEGAYEFNDLPKNLRGTFESTGWENRTEGFGALLYGGRVALAMRQFYEIDGARFNELFRNIRAENREVQSQTLEGRNAEFWFWESDAATLMVLRRGVKGNRYDMTITLGDKSLMNALDMSPAKAQGIVETLRADPDRKGAGDGSPTPRDGADKPKTDPKTQSTP